MKKRVLLSLVLLLIGVTIYLLCNSELNNSVFKIIRNYVPDICWTLSFFFMSINITKNITKKSIIVNLLYVISIAIIFEFMQYFKIVKGTFDIWDIIVYIFSAITACLIEIYLRRKENEKS